MTLSHSPAAQIGIQTSSPLAVIVGIYLLFAGHNNPGGGFAAGLVFGAVIALRTVAGLQRPAYARELTTIGLLIVATVAIAPLLWGDPLLDQQVISAQFPILGKVKSGSALVFDLGVTAIVIGLVVAVLDGLGASELGTPELGSAGPNAPDLDPTSPGGATTTTTTPTTSDPAQARRGE